MTSLLSMAAPYLPAMSELVAFPLKFMGPDQQLQIIPLKQPGSGVRAKVTTSSAALVWKAAILHSWITPENVHDLARANSSED